MSLWDRHRISDGGKGYFGRESCWVGIKVGEGWGEGGEWMEWG